VGKWVGWVPCSSDDAQAIWRVDALRCVRYALAAGGWRLAAGGWRLAGLGGEDGWMDVVDVVDVYRSVAVDEDGDVGVICVISTIYLSMRMCSERRRAGIPIRPPS
jgi:hypothetical protein